MDRVAINHRKRLGSKGDTIVEVLIAVAVVGAVLAGSFVATRRSLEATRTAQEQGEALKLAESQVEQIKVASATKSPDVTVKSGNFCIKDGAIQDVGCVNTNGISYNTTVSHTVPSNDFKVQVTWDSLSGGQNRVELVYRTE